MTKIDLKRELRHLYSPPKGQIVEVTVPRMNYLMMDGEGDPNTSPAYEDALKALYPVAYTLKFKLKRASDPVDYVVMPLEGLWWTDDMSQFSVDDKSNWKWTLMILQPPPVTPILVDEAIETVRTKKNPIALPKLRFQSFTEGTAAQTMHIGPFSEEGPTVAKIHNHIEGTGRSLTGKHHEIYLSDIRRADPKNWKTVIRQPMS